MNKKIINNINEQFEKECKVINLSSEYPDFVGNEKWAIVTDLGEAELSEKYEEYITQFRPFVILSSSFNEIRDDYRRNEKKHQMRSARTYSVFDYDSETKIHHLEVAVDSFENDIVINESNELIHLALNKLTPSQRKRIIEHFFKGKTLRQIALEEEKTYSTIYESYSNALMKLRDIFQTSKYSMFYSN